MYTNARRSVTSYIIVSVEASPSSEVGGAGCARGARGASRYNLSQAYATEEQRPSPGVWSSIEPVNAAT